MTRPPVGLLFDFDGTIADTLPHLCSAFRYAVAPVARRLPTDAEIVATFGPPEVENLRLLLSNPDIGQPGAVDFLSEAVARFHNYYEGKHDAIQTFPGIAEAFADAHRRGWPIGIFTGKSRRSAKFSLNALGLHTFVACIVAGDDVHRPKPDPEGVYQAADQMGLPTTRLWLIGDSAADIVAGRTAGAKTVAALWAAFDPNATRRAGPDLAFDEVAQFRDWLRSLP